MNTKKILEGINALEMENAKNEALRDSTMQQLCSLLNCEEADIDSSIASIEKRVVSAEKRIQDFETKIAETIPDEYKVRLGIM